MTATWWSQPFAPEGSATAGGILRQLGRPGLDELTILVREAAQNSWDARIADRVRFAISFEKLGDRLHAWHALGLPPRTQPSVTLDEDTWIIRVSDRGTFGLRGPIRASERPQEGEGNDFVQFLRNVGEPRDSELGGGTYGFGKGIFYRMSKASAIVVDSQVATIGGLERRLMGAALGEDYYDGNRRFTGRHWWGKIAPDGIPDPVTGSEAALMAAELGFPGFAGSETGTDVAIVLPDFGAFTLDGSDEPAERSPREAAEYVVSALLWNLWPKMTGDSPAMSFRVTVQDMELSVPRPSDVPDLKPFVSALERIRRGEGKAYRRGNALIGEFESVVYPWVPTLDPIYAKAKPFAGEPRHVARMRAAELVVDYLDMQTEVDPGLCYGAVFRAGRDADESFATAEPPTHDAWVEQGLDRHDLSIVRGARNWTKSKLRALYGKGPTEGGAAPGLGALATRLASLVPSINAIGADESISRDGGPPRSTRATVGRGAKARVAGAPTVLFKNRKPFVFARVEIPVSEERRSLRGQVRVVLEGGGRESEPPKGESVPSIVGWETLEGIRLSTGEALPVDHTTPAVVNLVATFVPDAVLRLSVSENASPTIGEEAPDA